MPLKESSEPHWLEVARFRGAAAVASACCGHGAARHRAGRYGQTFDPSKKSVVGMLVLADQRQRVMLALVGSMAAHDEIHDAGHEEPKMMMTVFTSGSCAP
jgi:hypothetical protein